METSGKIDGVPAEIRTEHLPNIKTRIRNKQIELCSTNYTDPPFPQYEMNILGLGIMFNFS
jgi:hypothetical protein